MTTRGIRNNNPGNIRKSKDKWQGLAKEQPDPEFCTFETPIWGIRAMARLLIRYYDYHDLNTVEKIVSRWAPENENNTDAYVKQVEKLSGLSPNELLDLHHFPHLSALIKAMIKVECGSQPYSDAQITKALVLAGVEPEKKSIAKSNAVKAATVVTTASVANPIIETVKTVSEHTPLIQTVFSLSPYALTFITIAGAAWFIYDRWDDRRKFIR